MSTSRALAAHIYDLLARDVCLAALIGPDPLITHGVGGPCDQPFEVHELPPIRREKQGWPHDFCRAVVTFGRFSRAPFSIFTNARDRSRESWTFVVGIFVRSTVTQNGESSPGDTWALDIYDEVVRILGDGPRLEDRLACRGDLLIARMDHEGDVDPINWQEDLRAWRILTRFRWATIGRSTRVPALDCDPCAPVSMAS